MEIETQVRLAVHTQSEWEKRYSYSRAIRVGNLVFTCMTSGRSFATGSYDPIPANQARQCIENVRQSLDAAGAALHDIVKYNVYISGHDVGQEILSVFGELFFGINPASSTIYTNFSNEKCFVEMDAIAIPGSMLSHKNEIYVELI